MKNKVDPFTRTPGIAGRAYIDNGVATEIIANFLSEESAKYIYKITGLRGSGKSVEYGRIIQTLKKEDGWLVYPLSASGEATSTLIARLSSEEFISSKRETTTVNSATSVQGNAIVVSGSETINVSKSYSENEKYYSDEAALVGMVTSTGKAGRKILIGIDDISKTPDMVKLLSIIGSMILEGLPVYLIVTGLADNIEDFSSEKNLTFFKRADTKEIRNLNRYDVTYMYEKLLGVSSNEAFLLEELSKGYAYAYQVLGSLYFGKKSSDTIDDIIPDFERILFRDSYDLIWKSLSAGEKEIVRCIIKSKTGKASEIKQQMANPSNYPIYRERLMGKHLVNGDVRGYLQIPLPRFDKFVEMWG